ncbi:hypothetical protein V6590_00285 [Gemmobacter sp. JM10B15]|uniref:Uncharacterized protein n=2 Tax=Gemmobacter denitrificans TaxID=3123040 RepID=A0ABU8BPD9_9RHOB
MAKLSMGELPGARHIRTVRLIGGPAQTGIRHAGAFLRHTLQSGSGSFFRQRIA